MPATPHISVPLHAPAILRAPNIACAADSSRIRFLPLLLACLLAATAVRAGVLGDDFNEEESHDYRGLPRWRLAVEGGYSQWIYNPDSLAPSYERYINTLEKGWDVSAQAAWFPWAKGGIGVEWIWFLSRSGRNNVQVDREGSVYDLRDRVSMVYYGPVFLSRVHFGRFGLLVGGFGAGLLDFHYTWTADGRPFVVDALTYAVVPQVGWEWAVYRLFSVGINGRAVLADLTEYTYNGQKVKLKQPEDPHYWNFIGLSRFEINAGVRFGLD